MGALRKVVLAILGLSFIVFVALFGRLPILRNTPIGYLHRLLCIHLPNAAAKTDHKLTNGRLTKTSGRLGQYLVHERHPIVLIFFLTLLTLPITAFLGAAGNQLPLHHRALAVLLSTTPYISTYLATHSSQSPLLTPSTHAASLTHYPYDHTLYHPRLPPCRTCHLSKPPRSRHCPICNTCVARHDHHCAWLNTCLGRRNYRWFLALMLSLSLLLPYGGYLTYLVLSPDVRSASTWRDVLERWANVVTRDVRVGGVGMLATMCAPLVSAMLAYHVYLIWAGMTTSESSKWAALAEDAADGSVWKAQRSRLFAMLRAKGGWDGRLYVDQTVLGNGDPIDGVEQESVEWPISSDQVVVRAEDGLPPLLHGHKRTEEDDGQWQQVWHLSQVENLYDLGFWDNLMDVVFPA